MLLRHHLLRHSNSNNTSKLSLLTTFLLDNAAVSTTFRPL